MKHICILFLFAFSLSVTGQGSIEDYKLIPPDFQKMQSYEEMDHALDVVLDLKPQATPEYVNSLMRQITQSSARDLGKLYAIVLLGELRPTNGAAVETLIARIDFKAPRIEPKTRIGLWGEYPAQEALIKIGIPSLKPLLDAVPNEINELRRHLMCGVLQQVEGKETAQHQITQMLASESAPTKKANLQALLKELEK